MVAGCPETAAQIREVKLVSISSTESRRQWWLPPHSVHTGKCVTPIQMTQPGQHADDTTETWVFMFETGLQQGHGLCESAIAGQTIQDLVADKH